MNTQACRYAIPAGLLLILLPLHRYPNLLLFTEYLFKIKHFFWWNCHSLFVIPQDQKCISGLDYLCQEFLSASLEGIEYFRAIASATFSPSIAAEVIPPA